MYTDFYRLSGKPFQLTPDPDFYVDTKTHHKAMAYLTYGLSQGEGFIIVTGDIGAGKTTLVARVLQQNAGGGIVIGNIVTSLVDGDDLLRLAVDSFGMQAAGTDKSALLSQLEQFLRSKRHEGKRVVLIVDEAQNLPFSALEEMRMLSNFQEGGEPLLQTVLLGQPEFRARLSTAPNLEQLRQRIIASHHLEPMKRDELETYIESRLARCGWNGDPAFTDAAYDTLYEASGGVPRRVNNIMSRVLLFGSLEETHEIDEALVREVVADYDADNAMPDRASFHRQVEMSRSGAAPSSAAASEADMAAANERFERLERQVDSQDKVIKQLMAMLSDMNGQLDELSGAPAMDPATHRAAE
ncbi:XrtA-associated ATPase [Pacificimonas sp. WHA3]|uniref:XrtA-associated ATPase n=1 Tax=Pacificimonas pallii TaxID=2827236 RepID=A0ABS6SFC4_9SPHN|nr:XrtA/PEP-CTERM system-associated ATPase [Pacificimonas pallii]MBV7257108.1 XrtA-associated ATPase [Pacificimonas pallii]